MYILWIKIIKVCEPLHKQEGKALPTLTFLVTLAWSQPDMGWAVAWWAAPVGDGGVAPQPRPAAGALSIQAPPPLLGGAV